MAKTQTKIKELLQIEVECATTRVWFTTEVVSMVIQEFALLYYLPPVPLVSFVELLRFMFSSYDLKLENLVEFNNDACKV